MMFRIFTIHYKPKDEFPFKFDGCLDMRHIDVRTQFYISERKLNLI